MKVTTNNSLLQFIKLVKSALNGKASSSHSHSAATTSANGFMSSTDKVKLENVAVDVEEALNLFLNSTSEAEIEAELGKILN